jgi:hypothetical protein
MSAVATRIHYDRAERTVTFERVQDVEPVLEANKARRSAPHTSDWGRLIADIPCVIIERWLHEEGVNVLGLPAREFARFIARKLDDPDWRHLRTDK